MYNRVQTQIKMIIALVSKRKYTFLNCQKFLHFVIINNLVVFFIIRFGLYFQSNQSFMLIIKTWCKFCSMSQIRDILLAGSRE